MDNRYDVIIIGAGPAGLTAAIYLRRAGLKVLILESMAPGGKMVKTFEIDNYPGYEHISGVDLSMKMFDQAQKLDAEYKYGLVKKVSVEDNYKIVECEDGNKYISKALIVATGTKENLLMIPGESEFTNKGVSYCAVCDGAFFKGKDVVVIGGGNSALEESLYLTGLVNRVYLIIRRDEFRGDKIAQDKVYSNPKITVIKKHIPVEIVGDSKLTGIRIKDVDSGEEKLIECSAVFPYIGASPCTDFLHYLDISDSKGFVEVDSNMETRIKGIFGAGDCINKNLRQIVTATNDGAIAAQNASNYINKEF